MMKIDWDPRVLADSLYYIPLLPLLGALVNGLFGKKLGRQNSALVACGAVGISAVLAALLLASMAAPALFSSRGFLSLHQTLGVWFRAGNILVNGALFVDHLNVILLMVITGVGFLIHVYSAEYMAHDEGYWRYFAYLNLFIAFMLILVMADNLVLTFVGWEGVGLCSYLLIGFWYEDDQKAYAGRKAFVMNRIGDFGFIVGVFTLFATFGTGDYAGLAKAVPVGFDLTAPLTQGPLATLGLTYGQATTLACLGLFVGVCGKSAQLPLYVWLPDAMAGPTPVSALIHAATMVTAGVYLVARCSFLFAHSPEAMFWVTSVGAATALFAALMGFAQNDIKKVLAYSTVSQLGYMVMAVGIGAYWQGVFHLVTHAFFKACLFLGAGSVILGCHHEQDIRKMGGLRKKMPDTAWTFFIATVAITGVLPLSGFFSKDAILHFAHGAKVAGHEHLGHLAYYLGSAAALCTAFYMFRLYFLVFEGTPRSEAAEHAHESGPAVTMPLWILALFSIVGLVWGFPRWPFAFNGAHGAEPIFQNFTAPIFAQANRILGLSASGGQEGLFAAFAIAWLIALAGCGLAYWLYRMDGIKKLEPMLESGPGKKVYDLVANKFYVDEIYDYLIVVPFRGASFLLWRAADVLLIDTVVVHGTAAVVAFVGRAARYVQNGDVQRYAAVMAIGTAVVIWAMSF
jgi:NADH-quinone oxidoreductase subunit L